MISGFKGRSISLEKIVKISREQLIKQAGSRYDPELTVVKAKAMRSQSPISDPVKEIEKLKEVNDEEKEVVEPIQQNEFSLPDSAKKINELITIIQTHKGDQEIVINGKAFLLNDEGIRKVRTLLIK